MKFTNNIIVSGTVTLNDEAYGSSWNGKLEAPTKNSLWDILGSGLDYVPLTRQLTIDGTTYDLTQNRSWTTNAITALTGEATATGPGSVNITLTNSAVIGKVLTGLNVTGGTISATDTILEAFGKTQNQINGLIGGLNYQGVWNASTNSPSLTSSTGTKGYYYKVSVAGSTNLDGTTTWQIGDWAIFNGTIWDKVDNTDSVSSVNGYTGAVSLTTADVPEVTNLYYTDARARSAVSLTTTGSSGAATYNSSTGVFNIPQYTSLGSFSATSPIFYNSGTGVISSQPASISQDGYVNQVAQTFAGSKSLTEALNLIGTNSTLNFNRSNNNQSATQFFITNSIAKWRVGLTPTTDDNYHIYNSNLSADAFSLNTSTSNAIFAGTVTASTFNGSGLGLSGVVLTSTNQTGIAGDKSWTGTHTFVTTGISPTTFQDLATNGRVMQATAGDGEVAWFYNNSATDPTLTLFNIGGGNLITGYNAFTPDIEVFRIAGSGSISSTPQGTLYGTATGSITSSQLRTSLTDETGTGSAVFSDSPTLVTPNIGLASSGIVGTTTGNITWESGSAGASRRWRWLTSQNVNGDMILQQSTTQTGSTFADMFGFNASGVATIYNLGTGSVQATSGVLSVTSDGRLKNSKGKFNNALQAIKKLKTPNFYTWKKSSGMPTNVTQFSLYANEVYDILGEEFAPTQKDGNHSIQDRALLSLTIQALQEALIKIEYLENKLNDIIK